MITITNTNLNITREPLTRPFGFKGGAFTEKWLAQVSLTGDDGRMTTGLGGLAVLWSDPDVFLEHSEVGGNLLMAAMLEYALKLAQGKRFVSPFELLDHVLEPTYQYGCQVTARKNLRPTFALNALVALDNAAWLLYAQNNRAVTFDAMLRESGMDVLPCRHRKIARVPLLSYQVGVNEIVKLVDEGHFFLKIKLGAAGDKDEMLAKDKQRLSEIHSAVGQRQTPHTPDGKLRYYLDANGRYPDRAALENLLDHADKIGARDMIALVEEPLAEGHTQSLAGLGVLIAADESLHDPQDVGQRASLGYGAIALKPAGKTLSMTLRMAQAAKKQGMSCFVADSACTPVSLDWNRNVAARLDPLPGLNVGLLESNGGQNYKNWQAMIDAHPCHGAGWLQPREGMFYLDDCFYKNGGGLLVSIADAVKI